MILNISWIFQLKRVYLFGPLFCLNGSKFPGPSGTKQTITSLFHAPSKCGFHRVKKHVFKTWVIFSDQNPRFLETWVFVGF